MDLNRLDLNLLKIFDSVYRLRSLTAVANEVNLSQPAISHALGRLRAALDDRLFIRAATGLEPTARADHLAVPVRNALAMLEDSLLGSEDFRPEQCTREFRLLLSDVGEMLFVPPLMSYLRDHAPQMKLKIVQASRVNYDGMLRDRDVDIAVGHLSLAGHNFREASLFRDRCVVLSRKAADPRRRRKLDAEEFQCRPHVVVSPPEDPVEDAFSHLNIVRRVNLTMPNYFALPRVIETSDLLATVPSTVAAHLHRHFAFDIHELPFAAPVFDVRMYWHLRQDADVAHGWLRGVFHSLFSGQASGQPPAAR